MHGFGMFLLAAGTLLQLYVFARILTLPQVKARVSRKLLLLAATIWWLTMAVGLTVRGANAGVIGVLELIGMNSLGSLFLIAICLLLVDALTLFGFAFRRLVPYIRLAALLCGVVLALVAMVQAVRAPVVRRYEIRLAGLPSQMDGTAVVAISDLHLGSTLNAAWLRARVAQVQSLHPDMIVLLGDLVEGHGPPKTDLLYQLRSLSAPHGVWAVPGNHESFGRTGDLKAFLQRANIELLNNESREISPGFVLTGIEDLTVQHYVKQKGDALGQTLRQRPPGTTILLSHSPLEVQEASSMGVDLMLSGHTHGGQIWPFSYFVQRMFPYMAGHYDIGGMHLVVSRGTGTWGPRMRLWYPGEILYILLRTEKQIGIRSPDGRTMTGASAMRHIIDDLTARSKKSGIRCGQSGWVICKSSWSG